METMQESFDLLIPSHSELDVTDEDAVERYIRSNQPDAILHLAAISNTGYCEEHPEESYLVNVVSVENLAKSAARHDIKLVWFSSDQIYNGNIELGPLSENIPYTFELPGGIYNFGAENLMNTYETDSLIIPDHERFPQHIRNISISMKKAYDASNGRIYFRDTITGLNAFEKNKTAE